MIVRGDSRLQTIRQIERIHIVTQMNYSTFSCSARFRVLYMPYSAFTQNSNPIPICLLHSTYPST